MVRLSRLVKFSTRVSRICSNSFGNWSDSLDFLSNFLQEQVGLVRIPAGLDRIGQMFWGKGAQSNFLQEKLGLLIIPLEAGRIGSTDCRGR